MDVVFRLPQSVFALVFLIASVTAIEIGYRIGIRTRPNLPKEDRAVVDTVYSGILGVVALLLGFTFAMAVSRFDARRHLVIEEANAIATTALRADLVDPAIGGGLKEHLRRYVDARLAMANAGADRAKLSAANAEAEAIQAQLWGSVRTLATQDTKAYPSSLLTIAMNEMFDVYGHRNAEWENRVPGEVWALMAGTVVVAMVGVGIRCGFAAKRLPITTALFAVVISLILMIIVDLDRPARGMITVSQAALERVRESLRE